ncbi:MAG: hypothetical protein CMO80_12945 [Verrucomicrobiales bacterium]|nr:hypothetical protein [Verrucomicrobiales bacterium]
MIGTMRKHSTILWSVIISFTVVAFVIFFTPEATNFGGPSASYGSYAGMEITRDERIQANRETELDVWRRIGQWPDSRFKDQMEQMSLRRTILLKRAEIEGITVSDDAVARYIRLMFSDRETEKFNLTMYNNFTGQVLKQRGITEKQFEDWIRHEIAIGQLTRMAGQSASLISTRAAKPMFERENETLQAMVCFVGRSNFLSQVKIETNQIARFFTNNPANYRISERAVVDYVYFSFTNYLKEAETNLTTRTNFAAMIDARYAARGTNDFKNDKGEALPAEEAKKQIREEILEDESTQLAQGKMREFANAVFRMDPVKAANLHTVAKDMGYTVKSTRPFTELDGPDDLDAPGNFASTAFRLSADEPLASPLTWVDGIYVMAFNRRVPPVDPPLSNVWNDVVRDFRRDQSSELLMESGLELAKKIRIGLSQGLTFQALCHTNGVKSVELPPATRFTRSLPQVEGFGVSANEVISQGFELEEGYASGFIESGNGGYIVFTSKRTAATTAVINDGLEEYVDNLRGQRQQLASREWEGREFQSSSYARQAAEEAAEAAQ